MDKKSYVFLEIQNKTILSGLFDRQNHAFGMNASISFLTLASFNSNKKF